MLHGIKMKGRAIKKTLPTRLQNIGQKTSNFCEFCKKCEELKIQENPQTGVLASLRPLAFSICFGIPTALSNPSVSCSRQTPLSFIPGNLYSFLS
jgi:hypothetical protein